MEKEFTKFADNIRLTENQQQDAKTKYEGVCEKLHKSYYETEYDGSTKFLFGSYKTKTNIRPLTPDQDVDVIFKIPDETYKRFKDYDGNGPSALLQEIREYLKEKYTTTDKIKAWVKVVLVQFSENTHNVEVLPAHEESDDSFTIPNSSDGGSWEKFDPRKEIDSFQDSNTKTNGLTADIVRMLKSWVHNTTSLGYKSYQLQNDVINFLSSNYKNGAEYSEYSRLMKDLFQYLKQNCDASIQSHVETALNRAIKANSLEKDRKFKEASEEWRKIFGTEFPIAENEQNTDSLTRVFCSPSRQYGMY